jgi:pimeloyl-ACP methyl ester carboxylesterase
MSAEALMGLEIRFCRRPDGARLAYAVLGSGPPLVWIPGWINHLEVMWDRSSYRRFFRRLASHHTVVLYDKHGVGLSDRDRTEFTLDADIADLRTILDALAVPRATLVGNSQAGAVAVAFAAEEPDRVDRLILHGAWAYRRDAYPETAHEAVLGLIRGHWGLAAGLFTDLFVPDADAESRAWFARFQRECASAETALGMLQLCYDLDVRPALSEVRAPTLVLHREGDRIVRRSLGREIASGIPDARFVTLPGTAHFPWEEDAGSVLDAMESFLGVGGAGTTGADPEDAPDGDHPALRRDGDVWVVGTAGQESLLKDVKGLHYLSELLRRPGVEAHAVELVAAVEGTPSQVATPERHLAARRGPDGDVGAPLDRVARTRFKQRVTQVRDELEDARSARDVDRAASLQAELDAITEQLATSVGLGGRDRVAATTTERARVKVTRLLRDAIRRVEAVEPELGHLLDTSVRTGTYCAYEPPPGGGPRWRL